MTMRADFEGFKKMIRPISDEEMLASVPRYTASTEDREFGSGLEAEMHTEFLAAAKAAMSTKAPVKAMHYKYMD